MVPVIFHNLINFEILKMDKSILPMFTTTWSSSEALPIMLNIMKCFDYSETFIKTV